MGADDIPESRVIRANAYLMEFLKSRIDGFAGHIRDVYENRRDGIYRLQDGNELMNLLLLMQSAHEHALLPPLVPGKYTDVEELVTYLNWFDAQLDDCQALLDLNKANEPQWEVNVTQEIKNHWKRCVGRLLSILDADEERLPYQQLKECLLAQDVDGFIKGIQSLLAGIPYHIRHSEEGYLHSNIHLLLSLLGFEVTSEEATHDGRIDAVIRLSRIIYIIEFKLGSAEEALRQIKEKRYADKYYIQGRTVTGVGVNFNERNTNIGDYRQEVLITTDRSSNSQPTDSADHNK